MGPLSIVWLISVTGFAIAACATPGPNNAMVASSGATFGMIRTLPHIFGIAIGYSAMLSVVALVGGEAISAHPSLHEGLRWVAAAYLLWLAIKIARAQPKAGSGVASQRSRPLTFLQAALFQWVNPKGWAMAISGAATYAAGNGPETTLSVLIMAGIFLVIGIGTSGLWAGIGAGVATFFRTDAQLRLFNLTMAALLAASIAGLWFEG